MPFANFAKLLGTLAAGSLPFSAMGLALGYFTGPNSAPATINLIYLPMSFCSGLWVPFMFLPKVVRQIALALPPYHLSQLALGVVGAGNHESTATHWEVLAAFTMICLGAANARAQKRLGGGSYYRRTMGLIVFTDGDDEVADSRAFPGGAGGGQQIAGEFVPGPIARHLGAHPFVQ